MTDAKAILPPDICFQTPILVAPTTFTTRDFCHPNQMPEFIMPANHLPPIASTTLTWCQPRHLAPKMFAIQDICHSRHYFLFFDDIYYNHIVCSIQRLLRLSKSCSCSNSPWGFFWDLQLRLMEPDSSPLCRGRRDCQDRPWWHFCLWSRTYPWGRRWGWSL